MSRAYDKLTRPRAFAKGELVLVFWRPIIIGKRAKSKFDSNWEGSFMIERVYEGGAYQLIDMNGERPMPPINGRFLKKYYA